MTYSFSFNRLTSAFILFTSIFAACKKEVKEPEPLPTTEAHFSRTFYYVESTLQTHVSYASAFIEAKAIKTEEGKLVIYFNVPYPRGNDYVSFTIEQSKIKPGYTGEYIIVPGDTSVFYMYSVSSGQFNISSRGYQQGKLTIASYNNKTNMLNGQFDIKWTSIYDPASNSINDPVKNTEVTLTGSFKNLLIE